MGTSIRAGRELDRVIAQRVMGYPVTQQKREVFEGTPKGTRPLQSYSTDIAAAWEVVEHMGITLIPVEGGMWFAFVGASERWKSPADFIRYLQQENFADAGAAVGESAPLTICIAAIKAAEKRELAAAEGAAGLTTGLGPSGDGSPASESDLDEPSPSPVITH